MRQQAVVARDRPTDAWRRTAVAALGVVFLVVGFIALASALSSADTSFVVAQFVSRAGDEHATTTLVVSGYGRSSAPAETATFQFVISPLGDQFASGGFRPTPPTEETEDDGVAMPFIDIILAQEISREAINVVVSPVYGNAPFYGASSPPGFRIDVHLSNPTGEQLNVLLNGVYQVARENGWYVADQGVIYAPKDCAALEREARTEAVEHARQQALQQADIINAELGELIQIADTARDGSSVFGCTGPVGTADMTIEENDVRFNPSTTILASQPYDPAASPEAVAEAGVELTYALPRD
jgi:uncharacterized protein YggE